MSDLTDAIIFTTNQLKEVGHEPDWEWWEIVDAARRVADAQKVIRPHQRELNRALRGALGRGKLSPWERDIESLLSVCDSLIDLPEKTDGVLKHHHDCDEVGCFDQPEEP